MLTKIVLLSSFGLFAFASCNQNKKSVCDCTLETTKHMIENAYKVDADNPYYPDGCKYMENLSQQEISEQMGDDCKEKILNLFVGHSE